MDEVTRSDLTSLLKPVSQLALLKEQLAISEARAGSDNPFVKGLKWQIAMHEKPRAQNPCI